MSVPAVVEEHLDAVKCWQNGKLVLGSSNLTGRYWNGSLWLFQDVNDAPDVEKCLSGIEVSSGICDILCIDGNRVVVATESGAIEVFRFDDELGQFSNVLLSCEHDDSILSICANSDKTNMISAGSDKCVKVWDMENFKTVATYRPVHAGIIWQASCSTVDPNIFLTCGQDGNLLLFDLRLPKPATVIEHCSSSEPTAVAWKPDSLTEFAAGDISGNATVKDIRKGQDFCMWQPHKRRIFRMAFSPTCKSWLATCADDTDISVTNLEKTSSAIYENNDHDDFVRGLTWSDDNVLISSGWDKKVLKHTISKLEAVK